MAKMEKRIKKAAKTANGPPPKPARERVFVMGPTGKCRMEDA